MEPDEELALLSSASTSSWSWSFNAPRTVPRDLVRQHLSDDVADIALPADHPLSEHDVVELARCADDEACVTWTREQFCHDWLLHTLRSTGREPSIAHTAAEHQTQLALVAAGLGAALVPRLGRGEVPPGVVLRPMRPPLTRQVHAVWRAEADRRRPSTPRSRRWSPGRDPD